MVKAYFLEAKRSLDMLEGDNICPDHFRTQAAQLKRCIVVSSVELTKLDIKMKKESGGFKLSRLVEMDSLLDVPFLSLA